MDEAEKMALLVKSTVERFGNIAADYAKDAGQAIKENDAVIQMLEVTKTKARDVTEKTKEIVGTNVQIAGSVIKDKSEIISVKVKEGIESVANVSKLQTRRASEVIKEKFVETKDVAQSAAVALEGRSKEVAKSVESAIKKTVSEASQTLKEKTEQRLTGLLSNLRGEEDKKYADACKTVCDYASKSGKSDVGCERTCLKVNQMRDEVMTLAKDIEVLKKTGK